MSRSDSYPELLKGVSAERTVTYLSFVLITLLGLASGSYPQDPAGVSWASISSPKGDVVVRLPNGYLVDSNSDGIEVRYRGHRESLSFEVVASGNQKSRVADSRKFYRPDDEEKFTQFTLGDFTGNISVWKTKGFSMTFFFASSKGLYRVIARADSPDNGVLKTFLNSIRLDGKPLVKQTTPENFSEKPVRIDELQTSPEVSRALGVPDQKDVRMTNSKAPAINADSDAYRVPAWILRMPRIETPDMVPGGERGEHVELQIRLGADGRIPEIFVEQGFQPTVIRLVTDAARRMKFIPAEKEGKPIDSFARLTYTWGFGFTYR